MPVRNGDPPFERRAADRCLAAQLAIARVLADSLHLSEATNKIIRSACASMDWDAGCLLEVDPTGRSLNCLDFWRSPECRLDVFESFRRKNPVPVGTGLAGLVWASGQPAWIPDIEQRGAGTFDSAAARAGLRCHFGFPIRLGRKVFGVMEFFSRRIRPPDYVLLQMMAVTGSMIGQFIKHKRGEEWLHESKEKYQLLFSEVSDAIVIFDPETGRIEDANAAALRFYRYSREELLRRNLLDLSADHRQEEHPAPLSLTGRRTLIGTQKRKDGTTFPAEITIGNFKWKERIMGIRVERDITERQKGQEAERLRHSEQMQREFVATVSHEFRTPVAAIQGFAETLESGGLNDIRNRMAFVVAIKRHANRLSRLVEDLLELSELESGKRPWNPENVVLAKFIRRFARSLAPLLKKKRLSIRVGLPSALKATVDKTQLSQVIQNLLANAIKFSPTRGRIRIAGRQTHHTVSVSISDDGIGIPEAELPHIFERFNHAGKARKPGGSGTGLGLSIAKQIIETHGGRIWAESGKGRGATFHFTLPRGE